MGRYPSWLGEKVPGLVTQRSRVRTPLMNTQAFKIKAKEQRKLPWHNNWDLKSGLQT